MTIGWAVIIVAVLFLLDKYHQLRKALIVSAITIGVVVVGYGAFIGYELLWDKWDEHHKPEMVFDSVPVQSSPKVGDPVPPGATFGTVNGTPAVEYGGNKPPPPPPPGFVPDDVIAQKDFAYGSSVTRINSVQRTGSSKLLSVICYNRLNGTSSNGVALIAGTLSCEPPLMLMEEVK